VLGPVRISRAWYHCGECKHGFAPRDQQLGVAGATESPGLAEIRYGLDEWIHWTRGVPLDPVLVKAQYRRALARMRHAAANKLNDWARDDPRLPNAGRATVSVQLVGLVPVSGTRSYQARWTEEHRNAEGILESRETWIATFTVEVEPPKDERALAANPIGLYITDFQWSREL